MRLIQLARELNISPGVLEDHLRASGSNTDINSNIRLDETTVIQLVEALAPARLKEFQGRQQRLTSEAQAAALVTAEAAPAEPVQPSADEVTVREELSADVQSDAVVLPDIIRAPKVELPGLKVVGKIELPEPPKKPEPQQPATEEASATDQRRGYSRSDRGQAGRRERRPQRDDNPIARERERQQRLAEKKRQEEIRRKKELRARAYEQSQARRQAAAGSKKKKSATSNGQEEVVRPRPKTFFGRFWRWLAHGE